MSDSRLHANCRGSGYLVARTVGNCPHCKQSTPLVALGLLPGHETLELDEGDVGAADTWDRATHSAFVFFIEYLPQTVQRRLAVLAPSFRFGRCESAAEFHWANHCAHCDAVLDDDALFCEPGGAFLPRSEAEARAIHLSTVDERLEAGAAGYAYEPEFFDAMSRD